MENNFMIHEAMVDNNYLSHFGIKGMKWGVRRFQNEDGSLTRRGKKKYGSKEAFEKTKSAKTAASEAKKASSRAVKSNKASGTHPGLSTGKKVLAGIGGIAVADLAASKALGQPSLIDAGKVGYKALRLKKALKGIKYIRP